MSRQPRSLWEQMESFLVTGAPCPPQCMTAHELRVQHQLRKHHRPSRILFKVPVTPPRIPKQRNQEHREPPHILQEKPFSIISSGRTVQGQLRDQPWIDHMLVQRRYPQVGTFQMRRPQAPLVLWPVSGPLMAIMPHLT
jgi:hypothetical protein